MSSPFSTSTPRRQVTCWWCPGFTGATSGRSSSEAESAMAAAWRLAMASRSELGAEGVNLRQNSGVFSDQDVFHFHLHVVPRMRTTPSSLAASGAIHRGCLLQMTAPSASASRTGSESD
ncbi:MAG: HIT domain-containing protein [Actinobacteria bacterium]|nr:MAG: HIT domain-containing protein [Actinomycetota bacterium]